LELRPKTRRYNSILSTTINFTPGDVLHPVRETFQLKAGALRLSAPSGKLTGKMVVDGCQEWRKRQWNA
jgi:hypothetical protein